MRLYKYKCIDCLIHAVLLILIALRDGLEKLVERVKTLYWSRIYFNTVIDRIKSYPIRKSEIPKRWTPKVMFKILFIVLLVGFITCLALAVIGFIIIWLEYPLGKELDETEKKLWALLLKVLYYVIGFQAMAFIIFWTIPLKALEKIELRNQIFRNRIMTLLEQDRHNEIYLV